jgi:ABC-type multidrug transport system permease subunit
MNVKKSLENRIRGLFPQEFQLQRLLVSMNSKVSKLESHLTLLFASLVGVAIIGLALVVLGFQDSIYGDMPPGWIFIELGAALLITAILVGVVIGIIRNVRKPK